VEEGLEVGKDYLERPETAAGGGITVLILLSPPSFIIFLYFSLRRGFISPFKPCTRNTPSTYETRKCTGGRDLSPPSESLLVFGTNYNLQCIQNTAAGPPKNRLNPSSAMSHRVFHHRTFITRLSATA
jgi:hypothetical protein